MDRKSAAILVMCSAGLIAAWGPLDPPNGPITGTYKTLTEVEPRTAVSVANTPGDADSVFRINKSGSYYLTGNLKGVSGKSGIVIAAGRVTLDLNGFAVEGTNGAVDGIHVNPWSGVTIRNGTVFDWQDGVDASLAAACSVESVTSYSCTGAAFKLGSMGSATGCVARTSLHGFEAPTNGVMADCRSDGNELGFDIGDGGVLTGCIASGGTTGFDIGTDAIVTRCSAEKGSADGFVCGGGSTLQECSARGNFGAGFQLNAQAVVTGCVARANMHGFVAEESAVLTDCNALDNSLAGFILVGRGRATRCSARGNNGGFSLSEANAVIECTASSNTVVGLEVKGNANTIERCTFHENGTHGAILWTGHGNTFDGNLCTYNTYDGLLIADSDNLAVRNRARGNKSANFEFSTGNDYGVILTNPGAGFASSAAWANFAY